MSTSVTGAVNGVPTTADVATASNLVTIPYFPGGTEDTLDVETDGSGLYTPNHRVAFIAGNVSGRDHLPQSVRTSGTTGVHPISMTVAQVCEAYWRTKEWHVYGSISRNTDSYTFDFTAKIGDDGSGVGISHEADLVLGPSLLSTDSAGAIEVDMFSADPIYDSGNIRPYVEFRIESIAVSVFAYTRNDDISRPNNVGVGHLRLASGAVFDLPFYTTPSSGTWDISFDVEASAFWPYATTTGAAVYNTSTGAQLRNPLS